ncbi:MAG: hypothetical protein ICV63_08790 [Coleofasciculus sp. Co-bin14]|nr:hypothetical protein [Coleofasciculus sp. Co-bin14]
MENTNFKKYEAVELKGVRLNEEDYKWWTGYYILEIEKDGSYLVSRTYQGNHNITQLTWPYRVSVDDIRKPETEPKLSVTGGVFSRQNFLQVYGASMVGAFYRDE